MQLAPSFSCHLVIVWGQWPFKSCNELICKAGIIICLAAPGKFLQAPGWGTQTMCISNAWHWWYCFPEPSLPEQMPGETRLFRDGVWTQAAENACEDKACCGWFFPFLKLLMLGVIRGLMSERSGCGNGWKMILRPKSFQVNRIPVFKASPKVNS